jgi:uncharacterized membrane protein YozB (DUF420 family)
VNTLVREASALNRRRFFVLMASAIVVAVFAGFAPTFYLRSSFVQTRPMSVLLHVHGVVFSAWIILFLVQSLLIARGSRRLHQRLGWATVAVAAAMVALVVAAIVEELRRGANGFPPPPLALSLSVFDITAFAILVGGAVYLRKRADWHKRFMLCATIILLGAPMFRTAVHLLGRGDMNRVSIVGTLLVDAFFVPCFLYDYVTRRKIHPALLIGFAIAIVDQIVQVWVVSWRPWTDLAYALQRLVA